MSQRLKAFLGRDWSALQTSKQAFWSTRQLSPLEAFAKVEELRQQAHALHPGSPTAEERAEDLRHHLVLSSRLRRVPRPRR